MQVMDIPSVMDRPTDGTGLSDACQVVLFNDNHNTCEHVMMCLMVIFRHSAVLAKKIMLEAHEKGKAIAQVESFEDAVKHVGQLKAAGLEAEVQGISTGI